MRTTGFVCFTLLLCFFAVTDAGAKTRRSSTSKKPAASSSAKKSPAKNSLSAKAGAKKSSGKKVASSSKKGKRSTTAKAQRAPRQSEPTSERYMEIQQALVARGLHAGPADGVWGAEWVAALKQFQEQQKLNPDGKLGALSLIALGLGPKREPMAQFAGKPESGQ